MSTTRVHTGLLAIAIAVAPLCLAGQTREWSQGRSLAWEDFLGAPDPASKGGALTAYEIQARSVCQDDQQAFRVEVLLLPRQSWVRADQRIPRVLSHEQGHFDLGEVTARRLRAALGQIGTSCESGDEAFRKVVADFQQRDADLQRSYDRQTVFGAEPDAQRQWEARIESWLREKPLW